MVISNTMSLSTLRSLLPDKLQRSPYCLYPYGNSKPLEPEGQVELVCERKNQYETLTFQVLPDSCIGSKPALPSGSDSEKLGLIRVHADDIHSLDSAADHLPSTQHNPPGLQASRPLDDNGAEQQMESMPGSPMAMSCNHLRQIHEKSADLCDPSPSPSRPVKVPPN